MTGRRRQVSVEVQLAVRSESVPDEASIERWAEAVMERMRDAVPPTDVCIRIVEEDESRALNGTYRGKDKPTNVLSFPADVVLPDSDSRILGDIVICDPVVRREARTQHKRLEEHYAHMVVHGMLHLYGYDHQDPAEADAMEDIEREILGHMGIGDPYRAA